MKNKFKIDYAIIAIFLLFFATRLINLNIIPIFTDEAIYSYWAKVALNDPIHRFISLEDGKQPLFIWIAAIFQNFINDPLIAARLVSFVSGLGSLIGVYLLSLELFKNLSFTTRQKIAKISSLLYVILPFTLLYDRLALFDSLLTMLGIYAVLFTIKMAKEPRLDTAMLNGFVIGLALITKSSGNFYLYLLPVSLLLFNFKQSKAFKKIIKWVFFSLITFILSQLIYNSLRLSPLFYIIERKNYEFIRTFNEVSSDPLLFVFSNFKNMVLWLAIYTSPPLFIIFIACLFYAFFKKELRLIYLTLLIFAPFFAEVFFNKVLYARFMLFYFPYLIILIAFFTVVILEKYKKYTNISLAVFLLMLSVPAFTSYKLLTDPARANIPEGDSNQYFNDWPAGYGVAEIVELLKRESRNQTIYVGTQGTFGIFPHSLNIYLWGNDNVHILSYWPVDPENLPSEITEIAENSLTYFVFNENQKEIVNPELKLIAKYQKGKSTSYMRLYEVLPK